jgi:hypothetical protein
LHNHFAPKTETPAEDALPEIILFKDDNFRGDKLTCYGDVHDLNALDFNDVCSSIIVVRGYWQCFNDIDFNSPSGPPIGPNGYAQLPPHSIGNDVISSVKFLHS